MKYLGLLGILLLGACTTLPAQPVTAVSDYCQIAQPVRVSKNDTRATKEQADREFRKWKSVCER